MAKTKISFGTAGWRGIISDDFTFDNVRIVSQAIAEYLNEELPNTDIKVVVGYDPRFLSEKFAAASSEVLAANGIKVFYSRADVPTPAIAHYIIKEGLCGGINITASHNPPEYSGIKFSPAWGGPALPETTKKIEEKCMVLQGNPGGIKRVDFDEATESKKIELVDLSGTYVSKIKETIDTELISKNTTFAYDAMHGSARSYFSKIINAESFRIINDNRDVLFGGHRPEPAEKYLGKLKDIIVKEKFDIGVSTDGDADRFGIMDSDGTFISPNQVIGLVLYHLNKKGYKGVAVRSVMTSSFVDAIAKDLGVEVIETPVGFKYIGEVFTKKDMIVGGEESGGLTIGGHLPEKDGILACLLMVELRAQEGKPLKEILKDLYEKVGNFITIRKNYELSTAAMNELRSKLHENDPESIGEFKVVQVKKIDGYKYVLDAENTWMGLRFSGTEPIVRLYIESNTQENVDILVKSAEKMFGI